MSILDNILGAMRDRFRNSHKIATTVPSRVGFNPIMIQREVIGVGNAPQYFNDAQMIALNSAVGGGTIAGNPPHSAIGGAPLDFQTHTIGAPTQNGTLTPSRELIGLAPQSLVLGDRR